RRVDGQQRAREEQLAERGQELRIVRLDERGPAGRDDVREFFLNHVEEVGLDDRGFLSAGGIAPKEIAGRTGCLRRRDRRCGARVIETVYHFIEFPSWLSCLVDDRGHRSCRHLL